MPEAPQVIPGEWLRLGLYRHFFEAGETSSLCNEAGKAQARAGEAVYRCQQCSQALAARQDRLVPEVKTIARMVDHERMAEKYWAAAAAEPNRFRRSLLLAEAMTHQVKASGWISRYKGVVRG